MVAEGGFDGLAFVFSEEAVVDEDAFELLADGFVEECGEDGGIDATGETADDGVAPPRADLFADGVDGVVDDVGHLPGAVGFADAVEEVFDDLRAVGGVGDFWVELDGVEGLGGVAHGGHGAGGGGGEGEEGGAEVFDLIAVGHPDGGFGGDADHEVRGVRREVQFCAAVFAGGGGFDVAAEELCGDLHAVADAEDGDAELEDAGVALGGVFFVDGGGAT